MMIPEDLERRLRSKVIDLAQRRGDHRERGHELDLRAGELLLEAAALPELTLKEAAQLLELSRPTCYRLMEEARKQHRREQRVEQHAGAEAERAS